MSPQADFRQLFELQPVPTWLLDDSGRTLMVNAQARVLLGGVDPQLELKADAPADPWQLLSILSPPARSRLRAVLVGIGSQAPIRLDDLWLEGPDHSRLRLDALIRRFEPDPCSGHGSQGGQCVLLQLIERQVQSAAGPEPSSWDGPHDPCDPHDSHDSRDPLMSETVFLNSNDAIVVTDALGRLRRVNPAFERLTGFSVGAWQHRFTELLQPGRAGTGELEAEILDAIRQQGRWSGEALLRTADAGERMVRLSLTALADADGCAQGYMAIIGDLTESRRASDEILRLATTDSLTGLPNRALFQDRLNQSVLLAQREQQTFALLFADLDHFKEVNDTLGHAVGDQLLIVIAHRLRDAVRDMDTVARLGGDEFVMLLPNISRAHALDLAERLVLQLNEPMLLEGMPDYRAQVSVGLVMFPDDGESAEALLRHADQAMYAAKRAGRNQLQAYTPELGQSMRQTFSQHQELRAAIDQGQLEVHWQPKFRLSDMAVIGVEALLRWRHPRLGLLCCCDFLRVAEQHQLLGAIDTWVLRTTLQQVAAWARQGRWPGDWKLALNQSASDLQQPHWFDQLRQLLAQLALNPAWLELELAEPAWSRPTSELLECLRQFRELGVSLLIDDFGTGYASLSYLRQLPVSGVKIDACFVQGMEEHESDRVLVEILCQLVRRLGLGLLAEGIETEAQRQLLLQMGCPYGQGYLLSPALPVAEFESRFLPPAR